MLVEKDSWTYKASHPWITFDIDLRQASAKLWMSLGEARSKCEHIAGVPLDPDHASDLYRVYLAKGALATTAIEGNTLSEEEVREYLSGKLRLPPSREYLGREVDNIVNACNRICDDVYKNGSSDITVDTFRWMNKAVLGGLAVDEDVIPGEIRRHSVTVGRYRGAPADECEYLLNRLADWLNSTTFRAPNGEETIYAIIKAVVAHLYIAWIHPFGDGNGRTARLLEFKILLMGGLPQPTAHLLSNHYNKTKSEYYRQLDAASRSGGNILPFIEYAVQGLVDGLREQVEFIRKHQWSVAWTNFVHESFSGEKSRSDHRRRSLALELSKKPGPIPIRELALLSPALALEYAGKTTKTLTRDINALIEKELVKKTPKGLVANRGKILAFLPWRHVEDC